MRIRNGFLRARSVIVVLMGCVLFGSGCAASYTSPGAGADMGAIGAKPDPRNNATDPGIRQAFEKKPLAHFPTGIAVARVQDAGYRSRTANTFGGGRYTVVLTRDVEKDADVGRLTKLPKVAGVAPINRLLLDSNLQSDVELRTAAARLQADMLLVYTFDTSFYVRDMAKPLTVITLGLSPNHEARVVTTASAVLMDTRTGYIYGLAEATAKTQQIANAWTDSDAVDDSRRRNEAEAFGNLVGELEKTWAGVVTRYSGENAAPAATAPTAMSVP